MDDDFDDSAPDVLRLAPFFEAEEPEHPDWDRFIAGFKDEEGEFWGAVVPVRRDVAELAVLKSMVLRPVIEADGTVRAVPEDKSAQFYAQLEEAGALEETTIDALIFEQVDESMDAPSEGEGGVLAAYHVLRERLKEALDVVNTEILRRSADLAPGSQQIN